MNRKSRLKLLTLAAAAAVSGSWLVTPMAADHADPPNRVGAALDAADIADLYAWHSTDTLTLVLTYSGPAMPAAGQSGMYDADVIYGVHIDNDGDNVADEDIWVRFGQNGLGEWGVQIEGLPGETDALRGAVETNLTGANAQAWVGLRDDPFFFDLQGFGDTLATGNLAFDNTRDSFAGQNVTALVIEVPIANALNGGSSLSIWSTSARF